MSNNKIQLRFWIIALMILVAALSRILPHPFNFTPIGGMALFGAAYFSKKYWAFLIPLLSFWISDLILNNVYYTAYYDGFQWFGSIWVYLSFILIVLLGFLLLKKLSIGRLVLASISASVLFFLITNAALVLVPQNALLYPKSLAGLALAYTAGLPFFWNTLLGDLFYTAVLFGAFEWLSRKYFNSQNILLRS